MQGGCSCGEVRYELASKPMFVNCCHCTWCQRETGSAFAVNALIETDRVTLKGARPLAVETPSHSGKGQMVMRCAKCHAAVWSHYGGNQKVAFIRVGTLDAGHGLEPDAHIFTSTKQAWVQLPSDKSVTPEFYNPKQVWPAETMARYMAARG